MPQIRKRYREAVGFYADAFTTEPTRTQDAARVDRNNAARCAVLASGEQSINKEASKASFYPAKLANRRSIGCVPTWTPRGSSLRKMRSPIQRDTLCGVIFGDGNWTPSSPVCAMQSPLQSYPRRNAEPGSSCGPMSIPC